MKGLIEIFYNPGAVFDYVRERQAWIVALIACMLLATAVRTYAVKTIGAENAARNAIEGSKSGANLNVDDKEKRIAMASSPVAVNIATVAVFIVTGVFFLIIAALFLPISAMGGGQIKFSQALGTVGYAAWPFTVLRAVLTVVILAISPDVTSLDPDRLLAFNIGAFLDRHTTPGPLFALATSLDVFILGQTLFAAWALSRVARIPFSKSLVGNLAIWAILTIIGMGFSLLG